MVGPQYRFVRREHWAISGQVLVGGAKGNFFANSAEFPGTLIGLWANGTNFSMALGVPIDYNISPSLAFRIQPGYWLTTFGSTRTGEESRLQCRPCVSIWAGNEDVWRGGRKPAVLFTRLGRIRGRMGVSIRHPMLVERTADPLRLRSGQALTSPLCRKADPGKPSAERRSLGCARDDKGEGDASMESGCWTERVFHLLRWAAGGLRPIFHSG